MNNPTCQTKFMELDVEDNPAYVDLSIERDLIR